MNKIKGLPRDENGIIKNRFPANGKEYTFIPSEEGISIARFNEYEKMSLVFGFGASFEGLVKQINQALEMTNDVFADKARASDVVLQLDAIRQGILNSSKTRNNAAFYICSLFIVTEQEDKTKWSIELADEKINDWNKEGYNAEDFLMLAANSVRGFKTVYKGLMNLLEAKV